MIIVFYCVDVKRVVLGISRFGGGVERGNFGFDCVYGVWYVCCLCVSDVEVVSCGVVFNYVVVFV